MRLFHRTQKWPEIASTGGFRDRYWAEFSRAGVFFADSPRGTRPPGRYIVAVDIPDDEAGPYRMEDNGLGWDYFMPSAVVNSHVPFLWRQLSSELENPPPA